MTKVLNILVRACDAACRGAMLLMVAVVAAEVLARSVLGLSMQLSDELGGYLLVAVAFLSLPVCQAARGFHQVTFVLNRLPPRGRAALSVALEALSLGFVLAVLWQLGRLELNSWVRGDTSDTLLAAPLWLPRLAMVAGMAVLALAVAASLAGACRRIAGAG